MSINENIKRIVILDSIEYRKHYDLINASYSLSLNEMKILSILLTTIKKDDNDLFVYQIPLSQFAFMYDNNNISRIKKIVDNMVTQTLKIEINSDYERLTIFSRIKYIKKEKVIEFKFNQDIKDYIIALKGSFIKYKLHYTLNCSSEYSIRLYEMLKQKLNLKIYTYSLQELNFILDTPESYRKKYNNFKTRVLEFVKNDLEKNTDLMFNYEEIKTGKSVTDIKFFIMPNIRNSLKDLKNFITYIRTNYINLDLIDYGHIKGGFIRVSSKGHLYLSTPDGNKPITKENSQKLWEYLHNNQNKMLIDLSMFQ